MRLIPQRAGGLAARAGWARVNLWLACVLALVSLPAASPSADPPLSEYDLKAAYLYQLAQYIQLPDSAFPDRGAPYTLGILGDDPFGAVLDGLVQGKSVRGRKLVIRRSRVPEELIGCQMVFLSNDRLAELTRELEVLKSHPVITVGQRSGFTRFGGVVNFSLKDSYIAMEINLAAAERAGAKVDYQLQRLPKVTLSRDGKEVPKP